MCKIILACRLTNTPSHGVVSEGVFYMRFDLGERWLRENDKDYGKNTIEYSYLNLKRLEKVYGKEIPVDPQIAEKVGWPA